MRSDGRCCEKKSSKDCKRYGSKTYNRFDMPVKNKTWEVDLGGDVDVYGVKIMNTASADYRSLRSATVEVLDKNNKVLVTKPLSDIISSEVDMVYIPIDVSPKDRNAEHLDPSKTAVTSHGACVCTTQDASACSKTDTAFAKFGPRRYDFLESLPEGTTGTCIRAKKGDALQDTLSTVWTTQERNVCGPECVKTSVRLAGVRRKAPGLHGGVPAWNGVEGQPVQGKTRPLRHDQGRVQGGPWGHSPNRKEQQPSADGLFGNARKDDRRERVLQRQNPSPGGVHEREDARAVRRDLQEPRLRQLYPQSQRLPLWLHGRETPVQDLEVKHTVPVLPVRLRERVAGGGGQQPAQRVRVRHDRRAERTGVEHPLRKNRKVGAF